LVVQRKPLDISHVYVYHVEGFRPGGGLYIFTPDEAGGQLRRIFDAGEGMITTADLSYDGREVVFALRRGGHIASNPIAQSALQHHARSGGGRIERRWSRRCGMDYAAVKRFEQRLARDSKKQFAETQSLDMPSGLA
jgi:hypothetical protein